MGGIVTRVARAKAAEWEEAKIVRRNTVDNAMLVQISADVIATARKPTAPRVVMQEQASERFFVEHEPSVVMYKVESQCTCGLPVCNCEFLHTVSVVTEVPQTSPPPGERVPDGGGDGLQHLPVRLGVWGTEQESPRSPLTPILRKPGSVSPARKRVSPAPAQAGKSVRNDEFAHRADGHYPHGKHATFAEDAGGEQRTNHDPAGAASPSSAGTVPVLKRQQTGTTWGSDVSRQLAKERLLMENAGDAAHLPQHVDGPHEASNGTAPDELAHGQSAVLQNGDDPAGVQNGEGVTLTQAGVAADAR